MSPAVSVFRAGLDRRSWSKFSSDAINSSDANPALVAKLLGHQGLEILMKHYFTENPEAMKNVGGTPGAGSSMMG